MKSLFLTFLLFLMLCGCVEKESITRFKIEVKDKNSPPLDSNLVAVVARFERLTFPNDSLLGIDTIYRAEDGNFEFSLNYSNADSYSIRYVNRIDYLNPQSISFDNISCRPSPCSISYLSGSEY